MIREVKWPEVAEQCEALGRLHHPEATQGREGAFALNRQMMAALDGAGMLRVFVAEADGTIVGYCLWHKDVSCEVEALNGMAQGPFFVRPDAGDPLLARRMIGAAIRTFRAEGVERLRFHHTMHGRGARAGVLYRYFGAEPYRQEYLLDMKEVRHGDR